MLLFEIGSVIYIMIKSSIPFGAAISEIWTFSAKGILASMGGLVGFFIFAYFFETEKEYYRHSYTKYRENSAYEQKERRCITDVGETEQIDNLTILTKNQELMERWGKWIELKECFSKR